MIGLMGVSDNGTLYAPNGKKLVRLPFQISCLVQKVQHWLARLTH
jgi:hypothetical protein